MRRIGELTFGNGRRNFKWIEGKYVEVRPKYRVLIVAPGECGAIVSPKARTLQIIYLLLAAELFVFTRRRFIMCLLSSSTMFSNAFAWEDCASPRIRGHFCECRETRAARCLVWAATTHRIHQRHRRTERRGIFAELEEGLCPSEAHGDPGQVH
ncbi:hypothetical protein B0H12DRAFT_818066 [Mycena haematopus]|nr:hypothetical protein B0H12DRAFT_818066 [Mycena haematopus]